jgi:outer membrane protein assembly factor BamB
MSRPRRYTLILGLLAVAGVLAVGWAVFRNRFPNFFDRETVNAEELAKLQAADLSQSATRDPAAAAAQGWPQFRGPNRDGWGSDADLNTDWTAKPPKTLWETPCGGGYSSLAVTNGRVYTQDRQGDDERVFCLDAATGKLLWEHREPADYGGLRMGYAGGPRATPTVAVGRVYTVGATGIALCLEEPAAASDKPRVVWRVDLPERFRAPTPGWGFACSPLLDGDLVILQPGGKDGSVVALDRRTGDTKWAAETDRSGYSSPVIATLGGVRQVVAVTGESVLGSRPATGEVLWRQPWDTQHDGNVAMPVVVGDYVFVSSNYNKGCALFHVSPAGNDAVEARVVYFRPNKVMRNHHSTCVHLNGYLYGFDNNDLRCVDLKTGDVVEDWPPPQVSGRLQKGGVIAAGNHLIGLTQRGTLFIGPADPTEFAFTGVMEKVLTGSECWAMPALAGGKLYLRDATKVLCLDVGK